MRRAEAVRRLFTLTAFACTLALAVASCVATPCPSAKPPPLTLVEPELPREAVPEPDVCLVAPDAPECSSQSWSEARRRWHVPRCAVTDPDCGPEVVRSIQKCSPSSARRIPLSPLSSYLRERLPACSFDGECKIDGCNKDCRHYRFAHAACSPDFKTLDSFEPVNSMPDPTWCGCVQGQCQLFTQ
jgi:hypothetical protein